MNSPSASDDFDDTSAGGERLQKVLANAGIGSRRQCEDLIREGRVEVDRTTVTQLGVRVDPTRQEIRVDGVPLPKPRRVYYLVNKPPGVVSTSRDPSGRTRVIDLVRSDLRLFTVGRLDRSSEGLILVTNDGGLAFRLTHPRFGVPKVYRVVVQGHPEWPQLQKLKEGVHLAEGIAKASEVRVRDRRKNHTELDIVLTEGRNREIRRLLARIGHKVVRLKRIALGPLQLGALPAGTHRELSPQEVKLLYDMASATPEQLAPPGRRRDRQAARPGGPGRKTAAGARRKKVGGPSGKGGPKKAAKKGVRPAKGKGARPVKGKGARPVKGKGTRPMKGAGPRKPATTARAGQAGSRPPKAGPKRRPQETGPPRRPPRDAGRFQGRILGSEDEGGPAPRPPIKKSRRKRPS